ncbi:hypothetical protein [Sorangium sp. So ce233]|uniref:hypothetical protein n=1 Tax=Sorangium sp. So ce233 TaxID=3133290 RepID=UPI003F64057E
MTVALTHQLTRSLLLEYLRDHPRDQYRNAAYGVVRLAKSKKLVGQGLNDEKHAEYAALRYVRELMWQLLVQGVLTFGMDNANETWPFYALTDYGMKVVSGEPPQPYDPDGFLADFRKKVSAAHPVVLEYLEEAVRAFNSGCPKASAVLLGGASEMAILDLIQVFGNAISDPQRKAKFEKETSGNSQISTRYSALKDRLDLMVSAKRLERDMVETVRNELPGAFELIRRIRNAAGHPEIPQNVEPDMVFLNLRIFNEYARRVYVLVEHFRSNPADW